MICVLESCKDFGGRPRELFCSPESRVELTLGVIAAGAIAGGAIGLAKGAKYALAGRSKPGKAMRAEEDLAAGRLGTPGAYGLSEAQKRSMTSDVVQAQRGGAGGLTEQSKSIERTARAQGPFGGGRATQALGQLGQAEAAGAAKAGGQAAALSSQVAQQQKATDIAAVQNAYLRRIRQYENWVEPALIAAGTGAAQAAGGQQAAGAVQAGAKYGTAESA